MINRAAIECMAKYAQVVLKIEDVEEDVYWGANLFLLVAVFPALDC